MLLSRLPHRNIKLGELAELLGEGGHCLLVLVFSLPFLQPIPLLGLSTPIGLCISLVGVFMFLDRPPWIPEKYRNKEISHEIIVKSSGVANKILKKLSFLKTRYGQNYFRRSLFKKICALIIVFNGLFLSLPLPIPFSNVVPAFALVLISFSVLEKSMFLFVISKLITLSLIWAPFAIYLNIK